MAELSYDEFLKRKQIVDIPTGLKDVSQINPMLFDFQGDITKWALRRGRASVFANCGCGKTPVQLEWAKHVCEYTSGNCLILAPLAVSKQTAREGKKFNIPVNIATCQKDVKKGINITNYQKLGKFDPSKFSAVVLDESSILKGLDSSTKEEILSSFKDCAFKLACTATPAPNDFMELGNHAEFMGAMTRSEMLSMFFVHDGGETQKWRLKGHAEDDFWRWVCSWAVMLRNPSDLGYSDDKFILPELKYHEHVVAVDNNNSADGFLFRMPASTLEERRKERKLTINDRCEAAAKLVNGNDEQWILWCNLNDEGATLKKMIPGSIDVNGAMDDEDQESAMMDFAAGKLRVLISKPSIAGMGLNFQNCHNVAFIGLSDSWEQFYQAIRRCWRFGQTKAVNCHIITAETEGAVVANIKRKESDAMKMAQGMIKHMQIYNQKDIRGTERDVLIYNPTTKIKLPSWL